MNDTRPKYLEAAVFVVLIAFSAGPAEAQIFAGLTNFFQQMTDWISSTGVPAALAVALAVCVVGAIAGGWRGFAVAIVAICAVFIYGSRTTILSSAGVS